ncbi:MAG: DUF559 domain-containing protein [Polyangiaceae bacterium]
MRIHAMHPRARVTSAALGVAAPGTPSGREVLMVARAQLLHDRAREMRHAPTASEERLWEQLRGSRLGVAFRRQVVVGGYIAHFAASSVRLVVVRVSSELGVEEAVARIAAALAG